MIVRFASLFERMYDKLEHFQQQRVDEAMKIFIADPFSSKLRNHKLVGDKRGLRAISAGYDLRILYKEEGGHALVLMVNVGTHDQVY